MFEHITVDNNVFEGAAVAVVGDIMLDTFIYGSVDRISPEAPVPVLCANKRTHTLGGAGNVSMNLASLGATPLMIGRVGNDNAHRTFEKICKENNIPTDYLIHSTIPTINKTRIVAQGQQIVRVDDEQIEPLNDVSRAEILKNLKEIRKKSSIVVVSDYAKGMIDQEMLEDIKKIWADGTVLVDPKPRKAISYKGVTAITPNLKEALELIADDGRVVKSDEEAADVATALATEFGLTSLLMTRSGDGMTLLNKGNISHYKPVEYHEVRDVSGAGDTVIAVLAASNAIGLSMEDATKLANLCGGIVVAKTGTATVHWAEIVEGLKKTGQYPPYVFR